MSDRRITAGQYKAAAKKNMQAQANRFFEEAQNKTQEATGLLLQQDKSPDTLKALVSHKNTMTNLLKQAEKARNFYSISGNKEMVKSIDNAAGYINRISAAIDGRTSVKAISENSVFQPAVGSIEAKAKDITEPGWNMPGTINYKKNQEAVENRAYNFRMMSRYGASSFDELTAKQEENLKNITDENRADIVRENNWIESYKRNIATDEDYKKAYESSKERTEALKNERKDLYKNGNKNMYAPGLQAKAQAEYYDKSKELNKEIAANEFHTDRYKDYDKYGKSNIDRWEQEVNGMSYSDMKEYLKDINTNKADVKLRSKMEKAEGGAEYLEWAEQNGKEYNVDDFLKYRSTNNYSDLNEKDINGLYQLEKNKKDFNTDNDRKLKSEYLKKYADANIDTYEDYQAKADEMEKEYEQSGVLGGYDVKQEFSDKYKDGYLRTKQEHNFTSLPEEEQTEMLKQARLRQQFQEATKSDGVRFEDAEGADEFDSRYLPSKKTELIDKYGYTEAEADSIIGYAIARANEDIAYERREEMERYGKEHPFKATFKSIPYSLSSGMGYADAMWQQLKTGFGGEKPIDYNSPSMRGSQQAQALREGVAENIESDFGKFVYDAVASTLDSMAAAPLGIVAPWMAGTILGSSAAMSSMLDGHEKGLNDAQAIGQGLAAGIFESLFEELSLDKIVDITGGTESIKNFLINTAKSMGIEGSEEGFTEIANITYDLLANGELSDYKLAVKSYREQGYTKAEAAAKAKSDLAARIAENVGGGMIGGAMFGGTFGAFNYATDTSSRAMQKVGNNVISNERFSEITDYINNNFASDSEMAELLKATNPEDAIEVGYLTTAAVKEESRMSDGRYAMSMVKKYTQKMEELGVPHKEALRMAEETVANNLSRKKGRVRTGEYAEEYKTTVEELKETNTQERRISYRKAAELQKITKGESLRQKFDKSTLKELKSKLKGKKKSGNISEDGTSYLVDSPETKLYNLIPTVGTDGETKVIEPDTKNVYDLSEVASDEGLVLLCEIGNDYVPKQREKFFEAYRESGNIGDAYEFGAAFKTAWEYGRDNKGINSVLNNPGVTVSLNEKQMRLAYEAGKQQFRENEKVRTENIVKGQNVKGTVKFDNVDRKKLNKLQKSAVRVAEILSEATGADFVFFESNADENGKFTQENGSYNRRTNTIRIDINAGRLSQEDTNNIMIGTLAHELTHYAEALSKTEYANLQEFVFDKLVEKTGKSIDTLIQEEIEIQKSQLDKNGTREITEDVAKSELVARGCELMLTNETAIRELAERDRGLFGKLKAKILEFVKAVKTACEAIFTKDGEIREGTVSNEAVLLNDYAHQMAVLWNEALKEAGENVRSNSDTGFENAESTSIRLSNRNTYPYNMQTVIQEYLNSVDENLKAAYENVQKGDRTFHRNKICNVSDSHAKDFEKITGISVYGYTYNVNTNALAHIDNRHGANGIQDNTMANSEDVGRIKYILENYDNVEIVTKQDSDEIDLSSEYRDSKDKPAKMVKMSKKINGTYYCVITVADNKYKKLWIVSAYINKRVTQASDVQAPESNVQNALASPLNQSINNAEENSNTQNDSLSQNRNLVADYAAAVNAGNQEQIETIFEEYGNESNNDIRYQKRIIIGQKGDYGLGVYLDNIRALDDNGNYLDNETLKSVVKSNFYKADRTILTVFDDKGNSQEVLIAKESDRNINKKGQKVKTINELVRKYNKKIKKIILLNLNEIAETSRDLKKDNTDNEHGWIDRNGWTYRIAYAETKDGSIYKMVLNIGKSDAGLLLFDIDKIKKVDDRVLSSEDDPSPITTTFDEIIEDNSPIVNEKKVDDAHGLSDGAGKSTESRSAEHLLKNNVTDISEKVNKNSKSDTQYQRRIPRTYSEALQQNLDYRKAVENLQRQFTVTKGHKVGLKGIERLADKLIRDTKTTLEKTDIKQQLEDIFKSSVTENLTAEETIDRLKGVVYQALRERKKTSDKRTYYAQKVLDDIKNHPIRLNDEQKQAIEHATGKTYKQWRMSMFGKVIFSDNGIPLDTRWSKLCAEYPDTFREDVNWINQPLELEDIIYELRNEYGDEYGFDMEDAAVYYATELLEEYMNLPEVITYADSQQKKLDAEHKHYQEQMAAVRKRYSDSYKEYNKKLNRNISEVEAYWKYERKIREENLKINYEKRMRDRIDNLREANWSQQEKEKLRNQIIRTVKSIGRMVAAPTNQRHAPEGFKAKTAEFCEIFTKNNSVFGFDALDKLRIAYEALRKGEQDENGNFVSYSLSGSYDGEIDEMIITLRDTMRFKRLSQLNLMELTQIKDIVDHFNHIIKNENQIWAEGRSEDLFKVGNTVLDELEAKGEKVVKRIKGISGAQDIISDSLYNNLTPVYYFKRLGGTFSGLYHEIQKGQDKWAKNIAKATSFIEETKEKYNYNEWDLKRELKFDNDISLGVEEAMYVYATAKREQKNKLQDAHHLQTGGIVLEKGIKAEGKVITQEKIQGQAYKINGTHLAQITNFLTDEQKKYVDKMVYYLSNNMAELGNETSMQLYGYKKFGETYYFPYKVADSEVATDPSGKSRINSSIKSQSFQKSTTKKANNAVIVGEFTDKVAEHINQMCLYNAMAIPQDNLNRVYNFKDIRWDEEEKSKVGSGKTVKQVLESVEGLHGRRYMDQFMENINGGIKTDPTEKPMDRMLSKFKRSAVFASLSVAIQQPSAVCRAMALVDPKYFTETVFTKRDWEEVKKYNGVAIVKEMGGFDTGTGQGAVEYLTNKIPETKFKRAVKTAEDAFGYLPGKMDEITWCHIWNAVKNEVADKNDIAKGSSEFYKKAAARFDEVINYTQVYDSVLSKSLNMNSKSTFMKMSTAFMTEPTLTYNLFLDAVTGKDKKYATRVLGAIVLQVVVNSMLKSLVQAARNSSDEDRDKSYMEKYAKAFSGDVIDDINPMGWIPIARDVLSIFEGYDVERTDMSLISEAASALMDTFKLMKGESKKSTGEVFENFISAFATLYGVPAENLSRDIRGVFNLYKDITGGNMISSGKGNLKRAFLEGVGVKTTKAELIKEYIDGDDEILEQLMSDKENEVKSKYPMYTDKQVKREAETYVRGLLTQQLKERYLTGNSDDKKEVVAFMKKSGLYKKESKGKKKDSSADTAKEWIKNDFKTRWITASSVEERKEIRKEMAKSKIWQNYLKLNKQIDSWNK